MSYIGCTDSEDNRIEKCVTAIDDHIESLCQQRQANDDVDQMRANFVVSLFDK